MEIGKRGKMITIQKLLEASYKINLIKLIDNYIEQEIAKEKIIKKQNELIKVYAEGWGETIGKWMGSTKNYLNKNFSDFRQSYNQNSNQSVPGNINQNTQPQQPQQNPQQANLANQQEYQLKQAQQAYEILKNSGLLNDANLEKQLNDIINNLNSTISKQNNSNPQAAGIPGVSVSAQKTESIEFKNWLVNEASLPKHYRPELEEPQIRKFEVSVGDIVEMGRETEHKGKIVNRISQVVEVREKEVVVKDLTRLGAKKQAVPISDLHDKEELRGQRIIPKEEKELKALGGSRLWVRLTPRQYKKHAHLYKAEKLSDIVPMDDSGPSLALKRMFTKSSAPSKPEVLPMFGDKKASGESPLKRFLAAKKGIFGGEN